MLHLDSLCVLDDLTDEQAGKLFRAIREFNAGQEVELDPLLKIAFSPFKNQFIRDGVKYQAVIERNKANGAKGGRPKKPKKPTGLNGNPKKPVAPKKADSVSDNESDSDSGSVKEKKSRFTPPTLEQVQAYCLERGNTVNPNSFLNHYESNGWMRGKTKIKDWKACVRTWESNQKSNSKPKYNGHNLSGKVYESGDL